MKISKRDVIGAVVEDVSYVQVTDRLATGITSVDMADAMFLAIVAYDAGQIEDLDDVASVLDGYYESTFKGGRK
jgi:ABC-type glycerol-3-phosphate transport system substrate-binding protein